MRYAFDFAHHETMSRGSLFYIELVKIGKPSYYLPKHEDASPHAQLRVLLRTVGRHSTKTL
jgi:hypothetical protein